MKKTIIPVADRAVEYILSRKLEELGSLTEEEIAQEVGVSLPYLLRNFKKNQNISLKNFITREKIHTAIFLLEKQKDLTIEDLAGKLGFPKINQFYDAFCGFIAVDPLTYKVLKRQNSPPLQISAH